ncbi:CBS domain-containing protein [Pseudodesulfovibrio cashew]|uniref:CBS domain-containing protein n=1 Tax=Pseudodesulfovibrio cashew TaxID=2678688 RepID=A0A6I6JGS8_9BACT|nr:CBS domain-containing protein [Pseudodesulfovibrio cashew]QGY41381.1 CBS domain-containing protein [Pseudodesulfovibrio cashew]
MLKVKDLMTYPVFSLRETDSLLNARTLMALQRIRHIPIVAEGDTFTGLLTHRDLLSATISKLAEVDPETQKEIDAGIPIREIMRTDVKTVTGETQVKEAALLLLNHKYGCLPVVEDKVLVGIVTEADFLRLTIRLMDALDEGK